MLSLISRRPKQEKHNKLRQFIGIVNYYRDMWFRRSNLLAPLTKVLLCYPDFNKPFHLYSDASGHQLGVVIMQDKKPIVFYSRNLNTAQKRYTTTERDRELLSAMSIEPCMEYKNIH
jgi:hypothetical protein